MRQDKIVPDGAALSDWFRIARSATTGLARELRHIRRKARSLRRRHNLTAWVLLTSVTAVMVGVLIGHFG